MKLFFCLVLVFGTSCSAHAAPPRCEVLTANADLMPDIFDYAVAGTGRLYFHSGPDSKCRDAHIFVVPGDKLKAEYEFGPKGEWTRAQFTTRQGIEVTGWVRTERLQFLEASGINMTEEKGEMYTKAAAAAKAGKLGSPLSR